jgi:excisionase family DNA binding protein
MTPAPATTERPSSPVLNLKEAAAYLGVSPASFQKLFSEDMGSAPQHKRVGGVILFRKEWLDEWLESCS